MHTTIKAYEAAYRAQLLAVWERSVQATHSFLDPGDFREIRELVHGIDFHAFAVYCLVQEEQVCGFIGIAGSKIEMLFLDPAYIGRGYGRLLMDFATKELAADEVDVNEQNEAACGFYRNMGFEPFERTETDDQGRAYPLLRMRLKAAHSGHEGQ